ncbi:MAG: tetratricopeptide repeat protein, partial [Synergistaceae bacterium]|nr:tetratricopeptide repeat protein [Synergistaceae bacterium]
PPTRPVEREFKDETINHQQESPDIDISNMNKAQQEAATGFQLSLDEPPPELWSNISNDDDNSQESSQLYEHYEQGINFQEYNNQTPHGKNFTQRLQRILHERQERASEQKKSEPVQNSYIKKAAIMCTSLVITLLIAWLVLIYLQKKTPDYLNAKALALYNSGEYEQAANEYQRAYKLYPDILTFLTGLAISSEKAGHLQTAKISWEEYINLLPENDSSDKEFARNELNRLNNQEREKTESPQIIPELEPEPAKIETTPQKTPPTFKELMREGTEALNLGIYNNAIINFSQAIELNPKDLRAYIGLAAAYRNKGLYFDAKRIIDDAIKKFGKNPTLLTELNFLKEAK